MQMYAKRDKKRGFIGYKIGLNEFYKVWSVMNK